MSLGALVNVLRKSRGLSLADIEKVTGINKAALSRFERDLEGLGVCNFDKLCLAYGTTPSVIYAISNSVSKHPDLLLDGNKLHATVRSLGKLIDNYLIASDELRLQVDKMLD